MRRLDAGVVASTRELTRSVIGPEALDVAIRWPTEGSFEYRAYSPTCICTLAVSDPWNRCYGRYVANTSEVPPLTDISVRRNLKGTSQAEAQLTLVVRNNLPIEVSTGYLEAMPWHLQFYLHTLRTSVDGVARGEFNVASRARGLRHVLATRTVYTYTPQNIG